MPEKLVEIWRGGGVPCSKLNSESEFDEFEPYLKSAKNRFQLSAVFNLEKLNAILIFEPRLKFFKFGLC